MLVEKSHGEVSGNLEGEVINFEIDAEARAHIMSVLTNLYSNRTLAVLREYATNALDAHVEVRQTRPIEVTLPQTYENTNLIIQDWGNGLSVDDLTNIYSRYGRSTKRDTNEQVGMLGLGCKSALTYADQFSLIAVKDSVKAHVIVSKDEEGAGQMTVVDTSVTDEPNGVQVIIPCPRHNRMREEAHDFFRFWPKGSVLVDGQEPDRVDGLWLTDSLLVVQDSRSFVVMGNVPYPVDRLQYPGPKLPVGQNLIAFVDVGDVHFPPSREALSYTKQTKDVLDKINEKYRKVLNAKIQAEIDAVKTPAEALAVLYKWKKSVGAEDLSKTLTYRGKEIPLTFESSRIIMTGANAYPENEHFQYQSISTHYLPDSVIVHGFSVKFNVNHSRKVAQWCEDKGIKPRHYLFVETEPTDTTWINYVVPYSEIKDIKLPYVGRGQSQRPRGSFDVFEKGTSRSGVAADTFDPDLKLVHMVPSDLSGPKQQTNLRNLLFAHEPDTLLVTMSAGRRAKYLRDFPYSQSIIDAIVEIYNGLTKDISDEHILASNIQSWVSFRYKDLDPTRIDDPEVKEAIRFLNLNVTKTVGTLENFERLYFIKSMSRKAPQWDNPFEKYGLLEHMGYYLNKNQDDIILYMNAKYAQESK